LLFDRKKKRGGSRETDSKFGLWMCNFKYDEMGEIEQVCTIDLLGKEDSPLFLLFAFCFSFQIVSISHPSVIDC